MDDFISSVSKGLVVATF